VTARIQKILAAGTAIRCPQCQHVFRLGEEPAAAPSAPVPKVTVRATPVREAGASDPPPRREVEDRPRSRSRDDYDDRPTRHRRRRSSQSSGSPVALLIAGAAILFILLGAVVITIFLIRGKDQGQVASTPSTPAPLLPGMARNQPVYTNPNEGPNYSGGPTYPGNSSPPIIHDGPANNPPPVPTGPGNSPNTPQKPPGDEPIGEEPPAGTTPVSTTAPASSGDTRQLVSPPARAANGKGDPAPEGDRLPLEVLTRVKRATAYIRVPMDKGLAMGSGFVAGDAKDIVLTNAHVIQMLRSDMVPKLIEVILYSGEPDEAVFRGEVLAVDRASDLAVLRIHPTKESKAAPLPQPIKFAPNTLLLETQHVFISGFPHGEQLGKNITIAPSSISSLRKTPEGELDQIQVNGGMTHGNSGGPVVDAAGSLVGVAVAGIEGTQLNFAVPADRVMSILNGRLANMKLGDPVVKQGNLAMTVSVEALDPLQRIKELTLDWWWGDSKDKVPAARGAAPALATGLTRQSIKMKSAGPNRFTAEVIFPRKFDTSKVMWLQPHYDTGPSEGLFVQGVPKEVETPPERRNATIVFRQKAGLGKVDMKSTNSLSFRTTEGEPKTLVINIDTQMTEQHDGNGQFRLRVADASDKFAVGFALDGKTARVRPEIQSAIKNFNHMALQYQTDRQGNVIAYQPQITGAPQDAIKGLNRFAAQLGRSMDFAAITFPNAPAAVGAWWSARRELPLMTADEDIAVEIPVVYTFLGVRKVGNKDMAIIRMTGATSPVISGRGGSGSVSGTVNGTAQVDVKLGQVAKVSATVDSTFTIRIHMEDGKVETVQARSRLDVKLTRTEK
jgi:S1-C subfamily serine protease